MKQQLQEDMKTAMRSKDQLTLTTVRGLIAEIKKAEIDSRTELTEDKIIDLIKREVKKRKEALKFAEDAGRAELVEQNQAELKVLSKYLGEQMSEEQLKDLISKMIEGGANNLGAIMGGLNKEHKGKFDNKAASDIAKNLLGG